MKPILTLTALIIAQVIYSQNYDFKSFTFDWLNNEKLTPAKNIVKNSLSQNGIDNAEWETKISSNGTETEVTASINPSDQNNLIVCPVRISNSITCPIYYTKDGGVTWKKSSFKPMPTKSGTLTAGGGDPVLVFTKNGTALISWIELYVNSANDIYNGEGFMGIYFATSKDGGETWQKEENHTILLGKVKFLNGAVQQVLDPISDKQWLAADHSNGENANNIYTSYVTLGQSGQNVNYNILCSTKNADSASFSDGVNITNGNFIFCQFSSLSVDNKGNVHVFFFGIANNNPDQFGIFHSMSRDGGTTFSAPNLVKTIKFNLPSLVTSNKDHIEGINDARIYPCIYSKCSPNSEDIYLTWTAFGTENESHKGTNIYFSKSTDDGDNWSTPIVVNDDENSESTHNFYSAIDVNEKGEIFISWYDRRENEGTGLLTEYYCASSKDKGETFQSNHKISGAHSDHKVFLNQQVAFSVGEYHSVIAANNKLYTFWVDTRHGNSASLIYSAIINQKSLYLEEVKPISESGFLKVNAFPNPANDHCLVNLISNVNAEVNLTLFNIAGQSVYDNILNITAGNTSFPLQLEQLEKGTYILKVMALSDTYRFEQTSKVITVQ